MIVTVNESGRTMLTCSCGKLAVSQNIGELSTTLDGPAQLKAWYAIAGEYLVQANGRIVCAACYRAPRG